MLVLIRVYSWFAYDDAVIWWRYQTDDTNRILAVPSVYESMCIDLRCLKSLRSLDRIPISCDLILPVVVSVR
jgi:hypothetical protein